MITLNIQNNESKKDRKVALFSSIGSITLFIVVTILIKFTISPPLPVDLPPLRSDEVIEESPNGVDVCHKPVSIGTPLKSSKTKAAVTCGVNTAAEMTNASSVMVWFFILDLVGEC